MTLATNVRPAFGVQGKACAMQRSTMRHNKIVTVIGDTIVLVYPKGVIVPLVIFFFVLRYRIVVRHYLCPGNQSSRESTVIVGAFEEVPGHWDYPEPLNTTRVVCIFSRRGGNTRGVRISPSGKQLFDKRNLRCVACPGEQVRVTIRTTLVQKWVEDVVKLATCCGKRAQIRNVVTEVYDHA